jgi:tetratricopeptide (TPR) repeat protein
MADAAAADIARAEEIAGQVVGALPRNPLVHFAKGQVLRAQYRFEEAIPEYEAAIEGNRNFVGALSSTIQARNLFCARPVSCGKSLHGPHLRRGATDSVGWPRRVCLVQDAEFA